MRELEKAVLFCILKDEKLEYVKLAEVSKGLFVEMNAWYEPIINYRSSGKPFDPVIMTGELGIDISKEAISFHGVLTSYQSYLGQLKKNMYMGELYKKIGNNELELSDLTKRL